MLQLRQSARNAGQIAPYQAPRRNLSGNRPGTHVKDARGRREAFVCIAEPRDVAIVWPYDEMGYPPPLACRFVEKAPRVGNYLYLRKPTPNGDREGAYWCVKMREPLGDKGDRWSTRCAPDEVMLALDIYLKYVDAAQKKEADLIAPGDRLVTDVLKDFVRAQAGRVHGGGDLKDSSFLRVTYAVDRLLPFVDGKLVKHVTRAFTDEFMEWAKGHMPGGAGYGHNTSRASVYAMRFALDSQLNTETHFYQCLFPMPREYLGGVEIFDAEDLEHIAYAARTGLVRDPLTGAWGDTPRPTKERRAAEAYERVPMIGAHYGERIDGILKLTWDGEDGTPWIDIEGKMIRGLTYGRKRGPKGTGDRLIPDSHIPIFLAWRTRDRLLKRRYVIHDWRGERLKAPNYRVWRGLLKAAGVKYLGFHGLKHTCVTILRIGGVPQEIAAIFLHTLPHTLNRYYGVRDVTTCRQAVEAIASLDTFRHWCRDRKANQEVIADLAAANANAPLAAAA